MRLSKCFFFVYCGIHCHHVLLQAALQNVEEEQEGEQRKSWHGRRTVFAALVRSGMTRWMARNDWRLVAMMGATSATAAVIITTSASSAGRMMMMVHGLMSAAASTPAIVAASSSSSWRSVLLSRSAVSSISIATTTAADTKTRPPVKTTLSSFLYSIAHLPSVSVIRLVAAFCVCFVFRTRWARSNGNGF